MAKTKKRLLIVDGYNVLRSGSRYRHLSDPDYTDDPFNKAREALINDVLAFAGQNTHAIIVFDGGRNEFSTGERQKIGGVTIMFSPAGSSADKVIEKLAYDARVRGVETMVVSSDATIQNTVFAEGINRMSANGFSQEMRMRTEDNRVSNSPQVARKNTVAERIDSQTLDKLKRLRDGM